MHHGCQTMVSKCVLMYLNQADLLIYWEPPITAVTMKIWRKQRCF